MVSLTMSLTVLIILALQAPLSVVLAADPTPVGQFGTVSYYQLE